MPRKKTLPLKFVITIAILSSIISSIFVIAGTIYFLDYRGILDGKDMEAEVSIDDQIDAAIERYVQKQQQQAADQQKSSQEQIMAQRENVPKKDKPEVELFIMSHCPYGTQIEKGILPSLYLLEDKIDFELKFVDYAMHDLKEITEQKAQYCVQEKTDKILDYLSCFLEEGNSDECLARNSIDADMIANCASATDEEFKITENYNNKETWMGSYPPFNINKEDARKYNVKGSPTLIVNGQEMPTGRDPASLLETICLGFENQPEECQKELPAQTPSTGFGFQNETGGLELDCIE